MWNPMENGVSEFDVTDGSDILVDIKQLEITVGNHAKCPVCGEGTIRDSSEYDCDQCGKPSMNCDDCGDYLDEDEVLYFNGQPYCHSCYERLFAECEFCNETHIRSEMINISGYGLVCGSCSYNEFTVCDDCIERFMDVFETTNGKSVCSSCLTRNYTRCDSCGGFAPDEEIRQEMCNECYEETTLEEEVG
jgi:formylmethanofuran dehydrogenase subunit E